MECFCCDSLAWRFFHTLSSGWSSDSINSWLLQRSQVPQSLNEEQQGLRQFIRGCQRKRRKWDKRNEPVSRLRDFKREDFKKIEGRLKEEQKVSTVLTRQSCEQTTRQKVKQSPGFLLFHILFPGSVLWILCVFIFSLVSCRQFL